MKLFIHKLTHWEYWPFKIVYIPIYFLWLYYAVKAKTIFFFNACNPTMKNGGFINDSKREIYDLIPQQFYPKTKFVTQKIELQKVKSILDQSQIQFPLIAKPDIGLRGSAVKKIYSIDDLFDYHSKANFDYLLQELIPYENEIGIFYVRYPDEKKGRITGIVGKEHLIVTGDGKSTIEELIKQNPRHELQLANLKKEYQNQLNDVLLSNEKRNLVPYGNHCRGAKFIDLSHCITNELTTVIDKMCQQIDGFYFGRMDLMYNTWEELEKGINFSVVELNGAASEPTHIYDPKHSIFFAWKELAKHITYMFEISQLNHKKGIPYLNHKDGMMEYRLHQNHFNIITNF
ncbi:MAG: D-alanine--D-alanine ligase [Bacteroidota bacterium]